MTTIVFKKLSLTAAMIFISMMAKAQWTSIAPLITGGGSAGNDGAVAFAIKGKGYIVAGASSNKIYAYDTLKNDWSFVDSVPPSMGRSFGMSFVINDKAYLVGGDVGGSPVSAVWEFNPLQQGNMWTQKNDFAGGIRDAGFGFAINNFGYIGAGNDNASLFNDIWKYSPSEDKWVKLGDLPVNGLIFPSTFVIGNKGYILTGGTAPSGVNEITSMWCLDASNDSLVAKASFKGKARQAAFAFSNGTYGFLGGGQASYSTNYNDMWTYDPVKDIWTSAPKVPLLGAAWSSAFVIGNNAYAGLGAKFDGAGLTGNLNFYKFNITRFTGIHELNNDNPGISVYPNPANSSLTIETKAPGKVYIEIYTSTGEKVMNQMIENTSTFSINSLPSGMYGIKITSDMGVEVRKVNVVHE